MLRTLGSKTSGRHGAPCELNDSRKEVESMAVGFSEPPMLTPGEAQRVFDRYGLGPVHRLEARRGGQINGVFLINGRYVLRLRPPEKKPGAFATEEALFRRLRTRLPVPHVLACDTSRE